jgi:ferredoxin-type protein NapH
MSAAEARARPAWLRRTAWRWLIARRGLQLGLLLLFVGTARWGWELGGVKLLTGNLSASTLLDAVPLADPFAVVQQLVARQPLESTVLVGAGLALLAYALLFGRAWCSWVCPLNMVTDLASSIRQRLGLNDALRLNRSVRDFALALSLVLSAITGVAAFEWVGPFGMLHRELILGIGFGWAAVLGVFLFDALALRQGWCGHLCPLGAFHALVSARTAQLTIAFDASTCTECGECVKVCPEPQVLNLKKAAEAAMVASGECTNCAQCLGVCPERTLSFDLRARILCRRNRNLLAPLGGRTT